MKSMLGNSSMTKLLLRWLSKVAPGVYHVSPECLGNSRYSINEMRRFPKDPAFLRENIHTVLETIFYVRASFFRPKIGDIRICQPPMIWHYNLTGPEAIMANEGNCGALSSLLNYLLKGKYTEVGFIACSDEEGGHVFNYVKQDDKYYFIDLLNYLYGSKAMEHSSTMIYEATSLEAYAAYYQQRSKKKIKLVVSYQSEHVLPMGRKKNEPIMYFPVEKPINLLLETPETGIVARFYDEKTERVCINKG
ncbi:hypothetical protein [Tindallia californiensis]|uniref:Transglutaminase-like superfamily protein n=1 Tax=Tindallia californiensis TaxID=159292 RepID=A0A1H3II06_9FIRM|nr:hypothetical protein [Tindallia californiensis]SDY27473.1 hypothetical protein SAMN05192546_101169 [Tindallia californiensis]